jgi:hypothetical protein
MYFYGSLRRDQYNHKQFVKKYGEDAFKWVMQTHIPAHILVDSGLGYPYAIKTDNSSDRVLVDVFDLSEQAAEAVARMELSAGYDMMKIYTGIMFVWRRAIPYGDWVKYNA